MSEEARRLRGDLLARPTLSAQGFNLGDDGMRRRPVQPMRTGRPIPQAVDSLGRKPRNPLAYCPRADAYGSCICLRRLPDQNQPDDPLSTHRGQTGILMDVHPIFPPDLKLRNLSIHRTDRVDNLRKGHS